MDIKLKFPPTAGGEEHGLNDPGVETFTGEIGHYIARECTQNVLDAPAELGKPVRLEFQLTTMKVGEIPCSDEFKGTLRACYDFWHDNKDAKKFFQQAIDSINGPRLHVLRISDFNTTGLTGSDDDRQGKWYCLVRSGGVSNKQGGTGGSFGIGKFAPFAASKLRTVFYSTRTTENQVAFQGVCRLVSHRDSQEEITQGTGYIGVYDSTVKAFHAVRQEALIPSGFRRQEPGTDIYILGFRDTSDWEKHLTFSVLQNFWPAIHKGKVTFQIGSLEISAANLEPLLQKYSADEDFDAYTYYQAYVSPKAVRFETEIELLGKVELFLLPDGEDQPNEVAMSRATGMVIQTRRFKSRKPFSGLFLCDNEVGNAVLRSLEPPRHDKWEPGRGGAAEQKALKDVERWIRDCVKKLSPPVEGGIDVPSLAQFLPDIDEGKDEEAPENSDQSEPAFLSRPAPKPVKVQVQKPIPPTSLENDDKSGGTDEGNSGGKGEGITPNEGNGGTGEAGGGGGKKGKAPKSKTGLRLRSYITDAGEYHCIIRSSEQFTGSIKILAVGEDGSETPAEIEAARSLEGNPIDFHGATIKGVKADPTTPATLSIKVKGQKKLSLTAAAL